MAVIAKTNLPRAMLIDMDDTILSAYGRPEIAWHTIANEFADELAPLSPQEVATSAGGRPASSPANSCAMAFHASCGRP